MVENVVNSGVSEDGGTEKILQMLRDIDEENKNKYILHENILKDIYNRLNIANVVNIKSHDYKHLFFKAFKGIKTGYYVAELREALGYVIIRYLGSDIKVIDTDLVRFEKSYEKYLNNYLDASQTVTASIMTEDIRVHTNGVVTYFYLERDENEEEIDYINLKTCTSDYYYIANKTWDTLLIDEAQMLIKDAKNKQE